MAFLNDTFNLTDELVANKDSLVDLILMSVEFAIIFAVAGMIIGIISLILSKMKGRW